jgi:hypothetical protein
VRLNSTRRPSLYTTGASLTFALAFAHGTGSIPTYDSASVVFYATRPKVFEYMDRGDLVIFSFY